MNRDNRMQNSVAPATKFCMQRFMGREQVKKEQEALHELEVGRAAVSLPRRTSALLPPRKAERRVKAAVCGHTRPTNNRQVHNPNNNLRTNPEDWP